MCVLVRAVTYATLFIAFLLVFLPARILAAAGKATTIEMITKSQSRSGTHAG